METKATRGALLWAFLFFGFTGAALPGVILDFVEIPLSRTALIGLAVAVGCVAVLYFWTALRHMRTCLHLDLTNGVYEELTFTVMRANAASAPGAECVVVETGSHTVVFAGGWWNKPRDPRVEWYGRADHDFPTSEITVQRLPLSGRIIAVAQSGESVPLQRAAAADGPNILIKHHWSIDCKLYDKPFAKIVAPTFQER